MIERFWDIFMYSSLMIGKIMLVPMLFLIWFEVMKIRKVLEGGEGLDGNEFD